MKAEIALAVEVSFFILHDNNNNNKKKEYWGSCDFNISKWNHTEKTLSSVFYDFTKV